MMAAPRATVTLSQWADRYLESRIDVDANTTKNYRSALKKAREHFGDRDPHDLRADDVAGWIADLAVTRKNAQTRGGRVAAMGRRRCGWLPATAATVGDKKRDRATRM